MPAPRDPRSPLNLEQQRKRARDLRRAHREGRIEAAVRRRPETVAARVERLERGELMGAIEYGLTRSVRAFVEAGAPVDNLFLAAGLGRLDVLAELLARGAELDARFPEGGFGTALHAASGMGRSDAVAFLLERGADASLRNRWEGTPAGTASFFGHHELARLIDAHRRGREA